MILNLYLKDINDKKSNNLVENFKIKGRLSASSGRQAWDSSVYLTSTKPGVLSPEPTQTKYQKAQLDKMPLATLKK